MGRGTLSLYISQLAKLNRIEPCPYDTEGLKNEVGAFNQTKRASGWHFYPLPCLCEEHRALAECRFRSLFRTIPVFRVTISPLRMSLRCFFPRTEKPDFKSSSKELDSWQDVGGVA